MPYEMFFCSQIQLFFFYQILFYINFNGFIKY